MNTRTREAFTLVEILIVVVILGILAAIVVPQFSQASDEAIKASLRRQLQMISTNIEVYRGQNHGLLPTQHATDPLGEGEAKNGWGILVSEQFLKEEPINGYTGSSLLIGGNYFTALSETSESANGWMYDVADDVLNVYACGFDPMADALQHE